MSYNPPYTITSKMVNLISSINEELTKIEYNKKDIITPKLNRFVPNLMIDLFGWLKNSDEHALIKSCVFHYEFEFIHPFSDGNGRIGRLWQSVILYHWKDVFVVMPTESIVRDNQDKYYKALEDSGNLGESTPFIEFMLEVILKTVLKVGNTFTDNQLKIIKSIHSNSKISANKLSQIVNISKRKIEENLAKLKELDILIRVGGTRGHWEVKESNEK